MRINGGKYLDSNNYSKILINKDRISISKSGQDALFYENNFINALRGKTDSEKIDSIISYYLKNNTINYMGNGVIKSIEGRKLMFNVNLNESGGLELINKYENDRLKSLSETMNKNLLLHLSSICTSYDNKGNYWLIYNDKEFNKLYDIEVQFLINLINIIFKDQIAYIAYENNTIKIMSFNSDRAIYLTKPVIKNCMYEICYAISEHNQNVQNIKEDKVIQLKLEVKNGK